jgi:hypothetical protein
MLAALASELLPASLRALLASQSSAVCSSSVRALSHLEASTSQQQQHHSGSGLPFALPEHEIEDGECAIRFTRPQHLQLQNEGRGDRRARSRCTDAFPDRH